MLAGKVAIITGSSNGIGLATAAHFAKLGCKLTVTGRNVEGLQEAVKQCIAAGLKQNEVVTVAGEITSEQTRQKLVDDSIKAFGKIDILINNAGIMPLDSVLGGTATLELFDKIFDVNVRSVIDLTNKCLPHILKTKGTIINVSSVVGYKPAPNLVFYSMSKAALNMYSKALAQELGSQGVRVNCINPGAIRTNLLTSTGVPGVDDAMKVKMYEQFAAAHALNRVGEAHETASVLAFLASDQASFVTGVCLPVDGGLLIHQQKFAH